MESLKQVVADILIVEDEAAHAEAIEEGLSRLGHNCIVVNDGQSALAQLKGRHFDIIVTDLKLGGEVDGLDVLRSAGKHQPGAKVILVTAHSSVQTCRSALHDGAFDYIEKPLELDELRAVVSRAAEATAQRRVIRELRERLDEKYGFENIIGHSPAMLRILDTGKELLANAIHTNSRRVAGRFVPINCAGLSETLLEDELFGHVKGAYTGAAVDRPGRFEHADGGTMFLDEIGDMPQAMQAKLLRVVEDGEVIRVGSNDPIRVNVRIISATNSDLAARVKEKRFREDLYFRIKGVTIEIPPLRQRREDIPLLIDHFVKLASHGRGTPLKGITAEARRVLTAWPWPGNVRQLRNVVENMAVLATGEKLTVDDLPPEIHIPPGQADQQRFGQLAGMSIEEAEKQLIRSTLKMVGGNREQAAKILGIGERTLYRKIKEYGLKD